MTLSNWYSFYSTAPFMRVYW